MVLEILIVLKMVLDIFDIPQNVSGNFDIPRNEHTYLHRIGRSGRWGRKGVAINFTSKHDAPRLKKFEEYYSTEIAEMPADYTKHLDMA